MLSAAEIPRGQIVMQVLAIFAFCYNFVHRRNFSLSPRCRWRKNAYPPDWISSLPFCMLLEPDGSDLYRASWRIAQLSKSETRLWFRRDPIWIYARVRPPSCPQNRYCFRFRSVSFRACMASSLPLWKRKLWFPTHSSTNIEILCRLLRQIVTNYVNKF